MQTDFSMHANGLVISLQVHLSGSRDPAALAALPHLLLLVRLWGSVCCATNWLCCSAAVAAAVDVSGKYRLLLSSDEEVFGGFRNLSKETDAEHISFGVSITQQQGLGRQKLKSAATM